MNLLVTAGPTCEDIDDVRFISNRSSGRSGYAVAEEAARRDHAVILVSGPVDLPPPEGVRLVRVRSAAEMHAACLERFRDVDALVAAAAVADFTPAQRTPGKIKKQPSDLVIRLTRTPDILLDLAKRRTRQAIVCFALESPPAGNDPGALSDPTGLASLRLNAEKKLREKGADAIVLNAPESFGRDRAHFALLTARGEWHALGLITKQSLAARLLDFLERHAGGQTSQG